MERMFALVTKQGTAAEETALCETHFTEEHKAQISPWSGQGTDEVVPDSWRDCTGNDVLTCNLCGIDAAGRTSREREDEQALG